MVKSELFWCYLRGKELLLSIDNLHGFYLEGRAAVFRECPDYSIEAGECFGSVERSNFDQYIFSVYGDLTMLSIDDWRY